MNINKITVSLLLSIAVVIILIYGKSLLIPLILALFIWFLVREIRALLKRVKLIRDKFPSWLLTLLSTLIIFSLSGIITRILTGSIRNLARSYPRYQHNIKLISDLINSTFNIDLADMIKNYAGDLDFGSILGSIFSSLTDILSNTFMIFIYVLFIFLEEKYFFKKLRLLFAIESQYDSVKEILSKIERSISRYIGLKTLVSLITGLLSYLTLMAIGVEAPIFWSFLIFLLNFIPTIGSLIGTFFPALYSLLQFGDFTPFVLVLSLVGTIQILVGNILEPKLMGNSLNISSLVALISLAFWGTLWGITGMLLSVPVTVMLIIIFAEFPHTRSIAIMLSEQGTV